MRFLRTRKRHILYTLLGIILAGFFLPENLIIPVEGATSKDWNPNSFWFYPWGRSVTHKGIDIFGRKGTAIYAPTFGLVLYTGEIAMGGKVTFLLGPKWRIHYFAHMDKITASSLSLLSRKDLIGTVGNSGNANNSPAHLHYAIYTIFPYPWRWDDSRQGWKKMFILDPGEQFATE